MQNSRRKRAEENHRLTWVGFMQLNEYLGLELKLV